MDEAKLDVILPRQLFAQIEPGKYDENHQCYYFLHAFELATGQTIQIAYSIGWNLENILEKRNSSTCQHDDPERSFFEF